MIYEPLTIFNGYQLTPFQQTTDVNYHAGIVYRLITEMIMFYIVGAYLGQLSQIFTYLSYVGTFVCLYFTTTATTEESKYWSHMLLSTNMGMTVGNTLKMIYFFDSTIITTSMTMALITFLTFTFVSRFVKSSYAVPLYGCLFSALSGLLCLSIFRLFFGGYHPVESIIALFIFSGFVTYDTYIMYEKFAKGDYNYYSHAIGLFLDIINLFVRFVEFFTNKRTNRKKKN